MVLGIVRLHAEHIGKIDNIQNVFTMYPPNDPHVEYILNKLVDYMQITFLGKF